MAISATPVHTRLPRSHCATAPWKGDKLNQEARFADALPHYIFFVSSVCKRNVIPMHKHHAIEA